MLMRIPLRAGRLSNWKKLIAYGQIVANLTTKANAG